MQSDSTIEEAKQNVRRLNAAMEAVNDLGYLSRGEFDTAAMVGMLNMLRVRAALMLEELLADRHIAFGVPSPISAEDTTPIEIPLDRCATAGHVWCAAKENGTIVGHACVRCGVRA